MEESTNSKENRNNIWFIILTAMVIAFLWGLNLFILYENVDKGILGDMFGPVNALFSGMALAGIIWAIILQKKELELQRRELRDTKKVLEGQKDELEAQNLSLKHQQIENTFFQLLKLHNDIISSFQFQLGREKEHFGRECFKYYYNQIRQNTQMPEYLLDEEKSLLYLDNFFKERLHIYGHYFNGFNEMLKFVDNMDLSENSTYISIIKAQLSQDELRLMFYYALCNAADNSLKTLIEKYSMFDKLIVENLIHIDNKRYYNEIAYGKHS